MNYASMLRGINVGGQKTIKMDGLISLYEGLGLKNVNTYIQSGNVMFSSDSNDIPHLQHLISQAIKEHYGYDVPIQIRTHEQLLTLIDNCPFDTSDMGHIFVTLLSSCPSETAVSTLQKFIVAPEQLVIIKDNVYLYCPHGYRHSKLSNNLLESKLQVSATTRNWRSVMKLYQLSSPHGG